MTMINPEIFNQMVESGFFNSEFFKFGFALLFVSFCIFYLFVTVTQLFDSILNYFGKRRDRKKYFEKHRFDRFRVEQTENSRFNVVEYIEGDYSFVIVRCDNFYNADFICQILNCDCLGAQYHPITYKRLLNCSKQLTNKNLKSTKSGERKEEK